MSLPSRRPSRVVVEPVAPVVDAGRFAAKASLGEPVTIVADVFTDGHDLVNAAVRYRPHGGEWDETPMVPLGNDRWTGAFDPDRLGRWEYEVVGWLDHFGSWRRGFLAKVDGGTDDDVDRRIGVDLLAPVVGRARGDDRAALAELRDRLEDGDLTGLTDEQLDARVWRCQSRSPVARTRRPLPVRVERERGRFSAWYEFFPRSTVEPAEGPGTLRDAVDRLDHVAEMGFDVVYLPPIHPIGRTARKGPNNVVDALPDDPGSPWAIGGAEGGHTAVHPDLGTLDDVAALVEACSERGLELALDIAFQCAPDHPWVSEHPEWFKRRPDGTTQYAENPPKKYQDIFPLDFESDDWQGLWEALRDVFEFWIERGVRIFRVDNPHTKAFAFWEWVIESLLSAHPDVILLSEAFTRPRVMQRLAKLGFTQSYTYFAWRQSSFDLREYFTELATETVDFLRPNAWPNTPDILTDQMQSGGRPVFITRAVLAATLSPNWGIYGPAFELQERIPLREGAEDYLDSEKYQVRRWALDRPDSLAPLISRLNGLRRRLTPLQHLRTLRFHDVDNPALLAYSKTDPHQRSAPVLVVVNLDPASAQSGTVGVDWAALGLAPDDVHEMCDRLGGSTYRWSPGRNYVELSPWATSAHVFTVEAVQG